MEITECLRHGIKHGQSYPETVRSFCLTLQYLKPRAYEFVRTKFNKNLPHQSTLRSWYQNSDIDASPGVSRSALEMVHRVSSRMEADNTLLLCNLIFDEIAIRKNIQWCNSTKDFLGYVDPPFNAFEDELPMASNAIVFMLSGINVPFQIPIAYYFITTLRGDQRSDILLKILGDLSSYNIRVISTTFDGYAANANMCTLLGAVIEGNTRPSFHNPCDGNDMHVLYDPSHMIKLARSKLGDYGVFYDDENHKIEWEYFVRLEKLSRESNIGLTHKLRKTHINWHERPMNVRIAVETLSNSVANAIEYLMRAGHQQFKNAGPTIKFIRIFDKLFDVMNSMGIRNEEPSKFKNALNPANKEAVFEFLVEAKAYIASLKIRSDSGAPIPITASRVKTGFRGFIINIISIMAIYTEYVEEKQWLQNLPVYRMSQDHLEIFFGKVRDMDGCNDNPNVQQFTSSYRRLYCQEDFSISNKSNIAIRSFSTILKITSRSRNHDRTPTNGIEDRSNEEFEDTVIDEMIGANRLNRIDYTNDVGLSFVAGIIEKRILGSGVSCEPCIRVLKENEKVDDDVCLSANQQKPCRSTFQICKLTELAMKIRNIELKPNKQTQLRLSSDVFRSVNYDRLYSRFFYDDHDISHKHFLINTIIEEFISIKCTRIARSKTLKAQEKYIRCTSKKTRTFVANKMLYSINSQSFLFDVQK